MSLPPAFLDEIRSRTVLSALIGRTVKLSKAGREFKGCCPFHSEQTPSFTVNDEKGFAHCFGCHAHVDAFGWLTLTAGMTFIDAVRQLADDAGLVMPERTPEAAAKAARIAGLRPALEAASGLFAGLLAGSAGAAARRFLAARGVDDAAIARFGLGWAPLDGGLRGQGFRQGDLLAAGLLGRSEGGFIYPRFKGRVMIPIADARGRVVAFGGRCLPEADGAAGAAKIAKYVNSPDSEIFDKGETLFNLHRAAPLAHQAGRVVVVEGYLDVIALDAVGVGEVVAPMGTALTEGQLARLWRVHHRPILLLDGDAAGRTAALRACRTAMPGIGPGHALAVALLPDGVDPDDLARAEGRDAVEAVLAAAVGLHEFVFDALCREAGLVPGSEGAAPETLAQLWQDLDDLARAVQHEETRRQYLMAWRARFERSFAMPGRAVQPVHALSFTEDGGYAFPLPENDSERQLLMIVRAKLALREERRALTERGRDMDAMAKAMGFDKKALNRVVADIERDSEIREEDEAIYVAYRRVAGVLGPVMEAMLPDAVDPRTRVTSARRSRLNDVIMLIEGRGA